MSDWRLDPDDFAHDDEAAAMAAQGDWESRGYAIDREELVAAIKAEADRWLDLPGGNTPGTFAFLAPSLLLGLASRIEVRA